MYNSPGTPTGTGIPSPSSTCNVAPAIARPIGTSPSPNRCPGNTARVAHPTTASVGPYSFTNTARGNRSRHRCTSAPPSASPPTTTRNPRSDDAANAGIACNVVAAVRHDHLFVPADRGAEAVAVLAAMSAGR